jgi:hypothetical protein
MTDWLEIARRELSPDPSEVFKVFTVSEPKDPQKSGLSEIARDQSPADDPIPEKRDPENPFLAEKGTAKTAEREVSEVFAVGKPEAAAEVGAGNAAIASAGTPPSGSEMTDGPLDEALRKQPKLIPEVVCPKNEKALDGEPRKPSKPLLASEPLSSDSGTVARWRRLLEDRTIVVERVRNLSRAGAEREAYRIIISEYLNETHPNTDPRVCAWCNKPDLPLTPTLPHGVGERHVWLHQHCHQAWSARRRTEVVATLARMGIVEPGANVA